MSVQFDSHKLELPAIYETEHNPDVLEYYDQPIKIKLKYSAKESKRNVGAIHTPDFFVMRQDGAFFRECKWDDDLIKLAEEMPNRYHQAPDGSWSCPPGEAYAARFKLGYTMYTSSQINWTYQRNMRFLEDYLLPGTPNVPDDLYEAIQIEVMKVPGITLSELLAQRGTQWADAIYRLVVLDKLYADLYAYPLPDPEHAHIFVDSMAARAYTTLEQGSVASPRPKMLRLQIGSSFVWDGNPWTVLNVGTTGTTLRSEHNKIIELSMNLWTLCCTRTSSRA